MIMGTNHLSISIRAAFESTFLLQAAGHDGDHLTQDRIVADLFNPGSHPAVDHPGTAFDEIAAT
jgi:hypothetical protein